MATTITIFTYILNHQRIHRSSTHIRWIKTHTQKRKCQSTPIMEIIIYQPNRYENKKSQIQQIISCTLKWNSQSQISTRQQC